MRSSSPSSARAATRTREQGASTARVQASRTASSRSSRSMRPVVTRAPSPPRTQNSPSASTGSTTATSGSRTAATSSRSSRRTRRSASATATPSSRRTACIRVYASTAGAPQTGVQDLNTFFGYPPAINRTTGVFGPDVIDPVCHYDPDNHASWSPSRRSSVSARRRLQREEHDRPGRLQHRRPDGLMDHLPRPGPERRHRRHARPRLHARRHGARAVLPGLPAHRRRPQRRLRHDERVRPVRAELQRRADLRLLEGAARRRTRRRSTSRSSRT